MACLRYLLLLLFVFVGNAYAQQNKIDSLESLVKSVPSDTNKVWLLNKLVAALREKDNNKALPYANEAKNLAELLNYQKGLVQALENLGWILYRKGDYTKSYEISAQALKISETLKDESAVARCLISIAAIHFEQKQYDRAIENFKMSYSVSKSIGDKKTMARSFNNIAYGMLQLNRVDSALYYIERALKLSKESGARYLTAFSQRTLSDIYFIKKDYKKAITNLEACLIIAGQEDNTFLKVSSLHRLGKVYKEIGQYDKALAYLLDNIALTQKFGYQEEEERALKLIGEVYALKNDIKNAFLYQTRYIQTHDSLYVQRQNEQIALMQTKFEAEIKEAQIALLLKEAQLDEEEINSQKVWTYFYIGCLSLFVILAFVLFSTNRYNSMAKKELEVKNKAINDQAQQLKNLNDTKDKLFSIISHDLRSPLASLKALMELVSTQGLTQEEFVHVTKMLKRNLDSVHEDLDNLLLWAQTQLKGLQAMPVPVNLKSLAEEKVGLFKETANNKNISIVNNIDEQAVVFADSNHITIALRNLIGNAIKFNEVGGSILLTSRDLGTFHEISVTDSGVGMSLDDLTKLFNAETHFTRPGTNKERGAGIGLLLTKEFIEKNEGSISVKSELGKGTTFSFTLKAQLEEVLI
jgi:signal transduction histidine kinase